MKNYLLLLLMALSLSMPIYAQNAPAGLDLPENQRILGHFDSDAIDDVGAGVSNASGKVTIGVIMESDEVDIFNGGIIKSFRVGLAESTPISKVFVIPITAGGAYGTMVQWQCEAGEAGWNVIELETPYQINLSDNDKLMIGFEYEQPTKTFKPLGMLNEGDIYDTYYYKKAGSQYRWTTAGLRSYGNLCVQCVVEKEHYPDVLIKANGLQSPGFIKRGDDLPFSFSVKNRGIRAIDAQTLNFDVKIDGQKVMTISNAEAIEPGIVATIEGAVETADLISGDHTLTIDNAVVGDEVLDYVFPMTTSFMAHSGAYPRQKHLIEQLTSTYCTYCPLGNSMLSILKSQRDDIIWVGLHGDLGSGIDPYTTAQGDSAMIYMTGGSISYPSAAFDRSTGWENDMVIVNGLGYYEEYHEEIAGELGSFFDYISSQKPTFATIDIDPVVNLETREAVITVSGEMTPDFDYLMGTDNLLTVYLTEDSIIARQLNNGSWILDYRHNGVFRCALGSVRGVELNRTADGYSNEFTVTIPQDWNINNLNVVAFISRPLTNGAAGKYTDMYVNNAESARLVQSTGGVEELLMEEDAMPIEYYDIMGRQHDSLQQGINIVKMSNGTTKKVLVK